MSDMDFVKSKLGDKLWRIESGYLYKIKSKELGVVPYIPNEQQKRLHREQRYRNVILKGRQMGFSTDIDIQLLDFALWTPNVNVGIIAHKLQAAREIFDNKVKFAFDNLPDYIRSMFIVDTDNVNQLKFSIDGKNWSSITVSTSFRGGTLQALHVSEFGKICNERPDIAKEIVEGAFEAVPKKGFIFIESTAEGNEGYFYQMCRKGKEFLDRGQKLTELDFKFHFFEWWKHSDYQLDGDVPITALDQKYFDRLENEKNIFLTKEQKNWYLKKRESYVSTGKDAIQSMSKEYPCYWEEAFFVPLEGAYYQDGMALANQQHRIHRVSFEPNLPVYAAWDLGHGSGGDDTAVWFFQLYGQEIRLIDYWAGNNLSLIDVYYTVIRPRGYNIETHYMPHDIGVSSMTDGKTRFDTMEELGMNIEIVPKLSVADGINAVRKILGRCFFDQEKCAEGIKCLRSYRRQWDEKRGVFLEKPLHDWSSHGADAFRYLAVSVGSGFDDDRDSKIVIADWMGGGNQSRIKRRVKEIWGR